MCHVNYRYYDICQHWRHTICICWAKNSEWLCRMDVSFSSCMVVDMCPQCVCWLSPAEFRRLECLAREKQKLTRRAEQRAAVVATGELGEWKPYRRPERPERPESEQSLAAWEDEGGDEYEDAESDNETGVDETDRTDKLLYDNSMDEGGMEKAASRLGEMRHKIAELDATEAKDATLLQRMQKAIETTNMPIIEAGGDARETRRSGAILSRLQWLQIPGLCEKGTRRTQWRSDRKSLNVI